MVGIAGFQANVFLGSESHAPSKTTGLPRCNFCCSPCATHHLLKSIWDPFIYWMNRSAILLKINWEFVYCNTLWVCAGKQEDINNFWVNWSDIFLVEWHGACGQRKKFARTVSLKWDHFAFLPTNIHLTVYVKMFRGVMHFPEDCDNKDPVAPGIHHRWHHLVKWHCKNTSFNLTVAW